LNNLESTVIPDPKKAILIHENKHQINTLTGKTNRKNSPVSTQSKKTITPNELINRKKRTKKTLEVSINTLLTTEKHQALKKH